MKIHLQLLLLLSIILYIVCACVQQPTCGECAGYAACYWCQSSGKCEEYYGEKFANLLCPNKWVQHQSLCSASSGNTKMDQILDILKHVNNYQNPQTSSGSSSSSSLAQQGNILPIKSMAERKKDGESSEELKELLHKLLLLKILRKLKSEGSSSLSAEDRQMLSQLTNANLGPVSTRTTTTTTTATKSPNGDMNNELKQLLSILKSQSAEGQTHSVVSKQPPRTKVKTTGVTSSVHAANHSSVGSQDKSKHISEGKVNSSESVMSLLKKIDEQNAGVVYEEHKTDVIVKPVKSSANTSQPMRPSKNESVVVGKEPTATSSAILNYCSLYQEIDLCNSDRNCTWCNTRDLCIQRSGDDYKSCVAAKDQMMDTEYGLDKCLALKHCKQCVENNKCYWCDVSKSCHTYPFIGYVPQTCGGDWYVKQCDVQLAVIIIVLPLIIILLAMVTFYFCLKYCYYRRKVLRVPLFEKPGVFDYRKDKKVYYVNPEDESSDTEMAAEKIRKKYRLPVEREPLIDPNS